MHPNRDFQRDDSWTSEELNTLYKMKKQEKKSWEEICKKIKKTKDAMRKKYARTNWEEFLKDPKSYNKKIGLGRKWTNDEMVKLDAYLQSGKSYEFIAENLGRSMSSVESQAQHTDWKAWKKVKDMPQEDNLSGISEEEKQSLEDQLIGALLTICRYEFDRLDAIKESDFLERINLEKEKLVIEFKDLKNNAKKELITLGFGNPDSKALSSGVYIVVGDSHGKHTRKEMFDLLDHVNSYVKPNNIIHIGHILDDDNDISYDWGRYSNLMILAKAEELRTIQDQRNKYNFKYEIIRESINIGDLTVNNQDMITDYVKTSISSLDSHIFDEKCVVNCHRLEFSTKCSNGSVSYFASPGCFCEKHTVRAVKQINFEDGKTIKQAYHDGFIKYRRMGHTSKYWEHGLLIISVDKDDNVTVIPCPIKYTSKGPTLAYFNKMISSKGVFNPDKKIFVNGDLHCDRHDINVLDIQEIICKDYKPDIHVNVGDTFNYSSLNHHVMDRGGIILDKKIIDEAAQVHFVLKRCYTWAKESHLIYGNHERFANDFVEKYPQFGNYLDFRFICNLDGIGYKLTSLKNVLKIGSAKFVHGEMKMFGQSGSQIEKASKTFGKDVFIGHIHRPEIRFGCYSVGLSGELDQNYNETEASNWLHGFGLCNQYMGQSWMTTIAIIENTCVIGKKTYRPSDVSSWQKKQYKAQIIYDIKSSGDMKF